MLVRFHSPNIFCEYGWRRFVFDGRRGFTDYPTVVPSGGWRSCFRVSGRQGAGGGRVVDLNYNARCHGD
ncbi:hypothetical protein Hanom_Chr08g00715601 [Helianthus anomalus]